MITIGEIKEKLLEVSSLGSNNAPNVNDLTVELAELSLVSLTVEYRDKIILEFSSDLISLKNAIILSELRPNEIELIGTNKVSLWWD